MSLAVGDAYGTKIPKLNSDPGGVERILFLAAPIRRFHLRLVILFPFGEQG